MKSQPNNKSENKKTEHFWAWVGKVSALLALVGGLLGVISHLSTPQGQLVADAHFGPIYWPPSTEPKPREVLQDFFESEDGQRMISRDFSPAAADLFEANASRLLELVLSRQELVSDLSLDGYWLLEVSNEGELPLSDVTLTLPEVQVATVSRPDHPPQKYIHATAFSLGILRPREKVQVLAWTQRNPSKILDSDQVSLSHQGGVGKLYFYGERTPLRRYIQKDTPLFVSQALMALIVILMLSSVPFVISLYRHRSGIAVTVSSAATSEPGSETAPPAAD